MNARRKFSGRSSILGVLSFAGLPTFVNSTQIKNGNFNFFLNTFFRERRTRVLSTVSQTKRKLKESQQRVLKSIAVDGNDSIINIHRKINLNYQRTRRAVNRLTQLRLIWLSKFDETLGPKAAQYYSITPYGIVEAFLSLLNDEETTKMIKNWESYTPHYVINFKKFQDEGILEYLKHILLGLYPDIVKPWGETLNHNHMTFNNQMCIIHSHILDTTLFYQLFEWGDNIERDFQDKFLNVVIQDSDFKKGWNRWIHVKRAVLDITELIYENLKERVSLD